MTAHTGAGAVKRRDDLLAAGGDLTRAINAELVKQATARVLETATDGLTGLDCATSRCGCFAEDCYPTRVTPLMPLLDLGMACQRSLVTVADNHHRAITDVREAIASPRGSGKATRQALAQWQALRLTDPDLLDPAPEEYFVAVPANRTQILRGHDRFLALGAAFADQHLFL